MLQRLSEKERAIAGEEFYDNLLCATGLALEQRARLDAKSLQSLEQWLACGTSADLRVGSPQAIEIEALGKRAPLGVSDALVEPGDDPTHGRSSNKLTQRFRVQRLFSKTVSGLVRCRKALTFLNSLNSRSIHGH